MPKTWGQHSPFSAFLLHPKRSMEMNNHPRETISRVVLCGKGKHREVLTGLTSTYPLVTVQGVFG